MQVDFVQVLGTARRWEVIGDRVCTVAIRQREVFCAHVDPWSKVHQEKVFTQRFTYQVLHFP